MALIELVSLVGACVMVMWLMGLVRERRDQREYNIFGYGC